MKNVDSATNLYKRYNFDSVGSLDRDIAYIRTESIHFAADEHKISIFVGAPQTPVVLHLFRFASVSLV